MSLSKGFFAEVHSKDLELKQTFKKKNIIAELANSSSIFD